MLAIQFCSKEGWSLTSLFISGTSRVCVLRQWVNDISMYGDTKNGCILSTNTPIKQRTKGCESDRRARTSRTKSWFWLNLPLTNESGLRKKEKHNANVFEPFVHQFYRNRLSFVFAFKYTPKTSYIDGTFVVDHDARNKERFWCDFCLGYEFVHQRPRFAVAILNAIFWQAVSVEQLRGISTSSKGVKR